MSPAEQKRILMEYLQLKIHQEDWVGLECVAKDLQRAPMPKVQPTTKPQAKRKPAPDLAAIPPVTMDIPHHQSEVVSMLRMSPNDLVERLFPDYTQEGIADANE